MSYDIDGDESVVGIIGVSDSSVGMTACHCKNSVERGRREKKNGEL